MKKDKEWFIKELLGHEIGDYGNYYNSGYEDGLAYTLKLAHQLDEPEKVVIPKFVADEIEFHKLDKDPLPSAFENVNLDDWLYGNMARNVDVLARAWLDGYEVEKEKLYYVLNGQGYFMLLVSRSVGAMQAGNVTFEDAKDRGVLSFYQLTEKQIKDYDERYWQFAVEVTEGNK